MLMKKYIHGFNLIEGMTWERMAKIAGYFSGDFEKAWLNGMQKDFERIGLDFELLENTRRKYDLEKSQEKLWENDIETICETDQEYPFEFKQLSRKPFLIYRKGAPLNSLGRKVAVVGMRKATLAGEKLAFQLGKALAGRGLAVISGLAFGIDAAAHNGVVQIKGQTVGVLASGIGKITPTSHNTLAEQILANGGSIISEYPMTSEAMKYKFIDRNRLIAALAGTVIIVEAAKRSGALITARHALEQNKDILVFPGDPGKVQAEGCNNLIKKGEGQLVNSIGDVMQFLQDEGVLGSDSVVLTDEQLNQMDRAILNLIREGVGETESLLEELPVEMGELLASLSNMEIAGLITRGNLLNWVPVN